MEPARTPSVEEYQAVGRYESLRKLLLSEPFAPYLSQPLAHWALPNDRRLPLAFLGRTLGDLLRSSFKELTATPGIGRVKLRSFVTLLARIADADRAEPDLPRAPLPASDPQAAAEGSDPNGFDPSAVSEVVWAQWRASVIRHGLGGEPLGRFAPTLRDMTRVIWNSPLETYAAMTLAEIRSLRTHGEKRVRGILSVFHSVHGLVAKMSAQPHLVLRIVPRNVDAAETWVGRMLQTPGIPGAEEIFDRFVGPLLDQIRADATPQIAALAENRLGNHGPITSVRQAARTIGLTRVRVYQLLNGINDILNVRWPMGRHQLYELSAKFQAELARIENPPHLKQFHAAVELFYPRNRRGASGSLERAAAPFPPADIGRQEDEADTATGNGRGRARSAVRLKAERAPVASRSEKGSRPKRANRHRIARPDTRA